MTQKIVHLGRLVGEIVQPGIYLTERRREHLFLKYDGFGMSCAVLEKLRHLGVHTIIVKHVKNPEKVAYYVATVSMFYDKGVHYTDREQDRQLILSREHMTRK